MRIVVNKHWRVYLDFGRAASLYLQLYWIYHSLLHMRVAVNSHALPVYKKNRIASLPGIFETTILVQTAKDKWAMVMSYMYLFCPNFSLCYGPPSKIITYVPLLNETHSFETLVCLTLFMLNILCNISILCVRVQRMLWRVYAYA